MTEDQTNQGIPASRLDLPAVSQKISELPGTGAIALPCLAEAEADQLISVVEKLHYRAAQSVTGTEKSPVHQDFELCYDIPVGHSLWQFAAGLEIFLTRALAETGVDGAGRQLRLNDMIVQRYPPGCRGITPHRDHIRYGFLIAIILLTGDGFFGLCDDRQGTGSREIQFEPGDLLLMGGPGLTSNFKRPFHFVTSVSETRRTIGLRYDTYKDAESV